MQKLNYKINLLVLALWAMVSACQGQKTKYPNTKEGVMQMAQALGEVSPSDIKKMAPTMEDCKAIMKNEEDAKKLHEYSEKGYERLTKMSESPIRGREGQTEILVNQLTVGGENMAEELKEFSGGYKKAVEKMKAGIVMYEFNFVEPGETRGRRFDGLMNVNNKWVLVPKFWRAFRN
ncbi:MAG TPA: hypothetical protein DCS93_30195 [Microscillaceae bacterium]|nr:hypothetical protein [Microscillaceae bacterium]